MGRPPTPTALKILTGAAAHDPGRINHDEPKPRIGAASPSWLPRYGPARSAWKTHVEVLERLRVLTEADAHALAIGCLALEEFLATRKDDKQWRRSADAWRRYQATLVQFGLTPSSRVKIHAIAPDVSADPVEQWIAAKASRG